MAGTLIGVVAEVERACRERQARELHYLLTAVLRPKRRHPPAQRDGGAEFAGLESYGNRGSGRVGDGVKPGLGFDRRHARGGMSSKSPLSLHAHRVVV